MQIWGGGCSTYYTHSLPSSSHIFNCILFTISAQRWSWSIVSSIMFGFYVKPTVTLFLPLFNPHSNIYLYMWPQLCTSYCGQFGGLKEQDIPNPCFHGAYILSSFLYIRELNITLKFSQPSLLWFFVYNFLFLSKKNYGIFFAEVKN